MQNFMQRPKMEKELTTINILTIGERFVGKTSLVKSFVGKKDSPLEYQAYVKKVTIDDKSYKLHLRSSKGLRSFFKRSLFLTVRGIVLVFDLTKRHTFDNLSVWISVLEFLDPSSNVFHSSPSEVPKLLIGNKCDLRKERAVKPTEAALLAARNNMTYMETNAVDDTNVEMAYITLTSIIIREYMNKHSKAQKSDSSTEQKILQQGASSSSVNCTNVS